MEKVMGFLGATGAWLRNQLSFDLEQKSATLASDEGLASLNTGCSLSCAERHVKTSLQVSHLPLKCTKWKSTAGLSHLWLLPLVLPASGHSGMVPASRSQLQSLLLRDTSSDVLAWNNLGPLPGFYFLYSMHFSGKCYICVLAFYFLTPSVSRGFSCSSLYP